MVANMQKAEILRKREPCVSETMYTLGEILKAPCIFYNLQFKKSFAVERYVNNIERYEFLHVSYLFQ